MIQQNDSIETLQHTREAAMKDKNRFSHLLKHLMTVAKLKNYVLAKELQYDESYISKWVTGSLLPTEKTSEKIFRDISHCVVASLDTESRGTLYSEYQVDHDRDLEDAIFDNLEAEFDYVMNLKESTGSEVALKTAFYPELTLAQFLKKMRHPVLRQVKSLDVIMATDILALDRHYQLALAELENSDNVNISQRSYPGVRFSMLINLDSPDTNNTYNVQFIQNLLTNLSNVDFQLFSCPQSQGKILFTVKDAYSISGMIMDENHCLSVTASEEAKNANALYDRLQSLCSQETLAVRRIGMPQMLRSNEYIQYSFARNQRWILSHVTEHFLPEELFTQLATEYCAQHKDVDYDSLARIYKLSTKVMESMRLKLLLSEDGLHTFVVTGMVDFFGQKMHITSQQRLQCLEYMSTAQEINPNLDYRILRYKNAIMLQHIPSPVVFLSDSYCYLRIARSGLSYNLSVLSHPKIRNIFREYFDDLWRDEENVDADYNTSVEMMRYLMQMVQVQILAEK